MTVGSADTTVADVVKMARDTDAQIIDLRFCDLPGVWQHFSLPGGS